MESSLILPDEFQPSKFYCSLILKACIYYTIGMSKSHLAIYTLLCLLLFGCEAEEPIEVVFSNSTTSSSSSASVKNTESSASVGNEPEIFSNTALPKSVLIEVPFSSQAPDGNWDPPYDEACEEISLIMAQRYLTNQSFTPQEADQEIRNLTTWVELQNLPVDITAEQLAQVASEYYNLQTKIMNEPTVDDLKQELAAGNPVILPLAGQRLGNPYYSGDGPPYHMLTVIGYTSTQFITNDPGTKRGAGYKYNYDVLMSAIHNWTGSKETIGQGEAVALVVLKN